VFRDELTNLFPDDELATRLSEQTYTLAEFLEEVGYKPPVLHRRAIVHGHCHHKTIMSTTPDRRVLDRMELDYEVLDSGCCGMAGSFGFEADKYDVSIAVGERVLLPAVRRAPYDAVILADGFSCREQIAQTTERGALHLAELLKLARDHGPDGLPTRPEEIGDRANEWHGLDRRSIALVTTASGLLAAVIARRRAR
jgi:Fe-S oxidoreductase